MYEETKEATVRAFRIGKILFSMGQDDYGKLADAIKSIKFPIDKDLSAYFEKGIDREEAIAEEVKKRYESAAVSHGFTKEQGLAILQYTIILEEIEE